MSSEEERIRELADELVYSEVSERDVRRASEWVSGYGSTVQALRALADVTEDEHEDTDAARLIRELARRLAPLEAARM